MTDAFWQRILPGFIRSRFAGRPYLEKIFENTGWMFFDKILRMGAGLVVGVWVARYLGPERFGSLSYALAFVALFSPLATLGLDNIVIREIIRGAGEKFEILGSTFAMKLTGCLTAALITTCAIVLFKPSQPLTQWLVGVTVFGNIFLAFDAIDLWHQSQLRSRYTVFAKSAAFLFISLVKVALILTQAPLIAFAWAGSAEIILASMALLIIYIKTGGDPRSWRWNRILAASLLRDSWPLIFSGIVIMIYMRIDQIMIGNMAGNEQVGIYSAAVRIAEAWYFIPMTIAASMFPGIVEARQVSEELFYKRLQQLYNLMALLAYSVAIPVTLLSGLIMTTLFGSRYAEGGPMLALLIWSGLFTNLGVARSSFLSTMNWTRVHFMTVFLGCIINVALNFALIPRYGGMGAVIASCVAYWFAAHGACFVYRPLFKTGYMLTRAMLYPKVW